MKLILIVLFISQNCFANGFDEITEFAKYLNAGSSSIEPVLITKNVLPIKGKNHFLSLELELGVSSPSEYSAKTNASSSIFYSRGMKSDLPEIRASLGLNFTTHISAQITYAHFEQTQSTSQATNFVFNSQTFLAGQTFTVKNSVNLFRGLGIYSFNPIGPFHLGLGLGVMNVGHKTSATMTSASASISKDLILPLLHAQSTVDLLGPIFMHGEFTSYPFKMINIQSDAAVGLGVNWDNLGFKIGSRWFQSALDQYELISKLTAQVFYGSISYKL